MKSLFSLLGCAALTFAVSQSSLTAALVFDNTTSDLGKNFSVPANVEVGDQISTINVGSSIITNFNFQYFLTGGSGSESARIRFYANDGAVSSSGPRTPGTVLFDSAFFIIGNTPRGVLAFDGTAGSPVATVPNNFTWTIEFNNLAVGATAGVTLYNPPAVGKDSLEYWDKSGGTWNLNTINGTFANFGAQVLAVPEPGTFALAGLAGLGLVAARRFSRKS